MRICTSKRSGPHRGDRRDSEEKERDYSVSKGGKVIMTLTIETYDEDRNEIPISENAKIIFIKILDSRYRTAKGVHPGPTIVEAEKIYGKLPQMVMTYGTDESGEFSNQPKGLSFEFTGKGKDDAGNYERWKGGDPREQYTTKYTPKAYILSISISSFD